jgi:tetratricopeptide (TPR) repeat protein
LELELLSGGDAIGCSLRGLVPEEPAYGWRIPVTDSTPPQQIAEQVRNRVAAFARVNELPQAHDPDLQPWFSLRTHALEAVRAFLEGIPYTLRFEEGSTRYYAKAAAIDPSFPAPLIWLTRSLLGTRAELATHRDRLAAARETASPFEKALIDMALALALPEPNWPEMQKHLEVALLYEPGNGPVLVVLAMAQSFNGNLDEALDTLSPLVERSWRYPSIYPQAAEYAIKLDRIERAKEILTIGLDVGAAAGAEPTLLDTWILLEALALFEGDTAAAERARLGLERRRGELPPDQVRILTGQALLHLTDRATEAGRPESGEAISRLLEEFSEKTD